MTVCFITYGCKVNQAETQKWELILKSHGYKITDKKEDADIWVINTCAVTQKAEIQSKKIINKAKDLGIRAIVTGCYVSLVNFENIKNIKFFNNTNKDKIINEFKLTYKTYKNNDLTFSRHRGIIKIQDGCDHYCSYCIVPYLRGNPRSVTKEEIIKQIKRYEQIGIQEIVLSGINLGLYGKDFNNQLIFNDLLKEILKKTKIPKIRLSSIEITHIDNEFLEIIGNQRICKHLHIPIQHGSNKILKFMNRNYDTETYISTFNKIVEVYPEISIGTDVIVGFPFETDEDFEKTLKLMENLKFSYLHVFTYSPRPLTIASKYKEQVPESIKKNRAEIMIELGKKLKESYIKKFIGSKLDAIIESKKRGLFIGTSDNYIKCIIKEENIQPRNLVKIKINRIENCMAIGTVVN